MVILLTWLTCSPATAPRVPSAMVTRHSEPRTEGRTYVYSVRQISEEITGLPPRPSETKKEALVVRSSISVFLDVKNDLLLTGSHRLTAALPSAGVTRYKVCTFGRASTLENMLISLREP